MCASAASKVQSERVMFCQPGGAVLGVALDAHARRAGIVTALTVGDADVAAVKTMSVGTVVYSEYTEMSLKQLS